MSTIRFHGELANTVGELPTVGSAAPAFALTAVDLSDLTSESLAGKRVVLNIFPSIDIGVYAASVREFNKRAASLDSTAVAYVSADLPFTASRFCATEGIDHVLVGSSSWSSFGKDYKVALLDTPLAGLLARAVVILDAGETVLHRELASDIADAPDYDAAVAVFWRALPGPSLSTRPCGRV